MENKKVWIVGKFLKSDGLEWEFSGVFSTEEKAVAQCRSKSYFVAPAIIDEEIPDEAIRWDGLYYPIYACLRMRLTNEK